MEVVSMAFPPMLFDCEKIGQGGLDRTAPYFLV